MAGPLGDGLTVRRDDGSDPGAGQVAGIPAVSADIPVTAASVRWERPTARSFWNSLADPERDALAAAGVEEVFRPGAVLCRAGDDTSQVMVIDSGWVKVSLREGPDTAEKILAVRGQGDVVGERAALTTSVRSATVTALDEVSAMVVPAERFAEFLRGHPRAAEVLERQVTERREEDRMRLFPGDRPARSGAWPGCCWTWPSAGAATSTRCSPCRCRRPNSRTGPGRARTRWAGSCGRGGTAGSSRAASGPAG